MHKERYITLIRRWQPWFSVLVSFHVGSAGIAAHSFAARTCHAGTSNGKEQSGQEFRPGTANHSADASGTICIDSPDHSYTVSNYSGDRAYSSVGVRDSSSRVAYW